MYSEENGLPGVREIHSIRIAERTGSQQQQQRDQHAQEKQHGERDEEQDQKNASTHEYIDNSDFIFYTIELGRLLIEKQNIEQTLYTDSIGEEPDDHDSDRDHVDLEQVKIRIADLEQQIANLGTASHPVSPIEPDLQLDFSVGQLRNLEIAYGKYYERTERETEAIEVEDLDRLRKLMTQKKRLLEYIRKIHGAINYDILRNLPKESQKKTKANAILSDINLKIRRIIDKENENSVELQNRKEEVRVELGKKNAGMRAISKYATMKPDSHYIDTTK